MKKMTLSIVALMTSLVACSCESTTENVAPATPPTTVVAPQPKPEVTPEPASDAKFAIGDKVTIALPNGKAINGEVVGVGKIIKFGMPDGTVRTSRAYSVVAAVERKIRDQTVTVIMEGVVPEFTLSLR